MSLAKLTSARPEDCIGPIGAFSNDESRVVFSDSDSWLLLKQIDLSTLFESELTNGENSITLVVTRGENVTFRESDNPESVMLFFSCSTNLSIARGLIKSGLMD